MAHLHEMRDSDKHFVINPENMVITNNSKKKALQQGDHRSEIYTFELPRQLDGHDMTLCNLVEIHYININGDKTERSKGVHKVIDMAVSEDDPDTLVFTWLVHGDATKYAGTLNFRIHFYCTNTNGEQTYKKHTEIFKGISISEGFDNAAAIEEDNSDILSQWEARLDALESGQMTDAVYFDIDDNGLVSLKADYRADGSKNAELPEVIVIPDVIDGTAVTALKDSMFENNTRVKSITIPGLVSTIPKKFANCTINLVEINGTENVEVIGQAAFQKSAIKKALFPNLKSLEGAAQFNSSPSLAIVDIGNYVTSIPTGCFHCCESLSAVRGGASVTVYGDKCFDWTRNLKNLPIVANAKSIGAQAFECSRVQFDWWTFKETSGCKFGNNSNATPAHFNPSKWWENCTHTACENPLGSVFSQENPEWADYHIPNSSDNYANGCLETSTAHIYSALKGVVLDSPKQFVEEIVGGYKNGELFVPTGKNTDTGERYYLYEDMAAWLNALELDAKVLSGGWNNENLKEVYNALADGALVLTSINPGHAGVIYGVTEGGEMMVLDSSSYQRNLNNFIPVKYKMKIQNLTVQGGSVVIVKK